MFLCDNCHNQYNHLSSYSYGRCEGCGKQKKCIDCHEPICKPSKKKFYKDGK